MQTSLVGILIPQTLTVGGKRLKVGFGGKFFPGGGSHNPATRVRSATTPLFTSGLTKATQHPTKKAAACKINIHVTNDKQSSTSSSSAAHRPSSKAAGAVAAQRLIAYGS